MWSRPCWGLSSPRAPTIGRTIAGALSYHRVTRRRFLRGSMRNVRTTLLLFVLARPLIAQGEPPQVTADEPYTMEYYYKVQWGHQQEFLCLSLKNHYPLLPKGVESGRMISVKIETPANHMTEDARWDYGVTIKFKDSTVATTANPQEESWISQLWPDQETYKREEQRRFQNLLAHWDLPGTDGTPPQKKSDHVKNGGFGAKGVQPARPSPPPAVAAGARCG